MCKYLGVRWSKICVDYGGVVDVVSPVVSGATPIIRYFRGDRNRFAVPQGLLDPFGRLRRPQLCDNRGCRVPAGERISPGGGSARGQKNSGVCSGVLGGHHALHLARQRLHHLPRHQKIPRD